MGFAEYPFNTEAVKLPYVVCGIGIMDSQPHVVREQGMCVNQLMFTVSGCGRVRCGENEYRLPVGTGVILPEWIPHEYFSEGESDWGLCWLIFSGEGIGKTLEHYGFDGSSPVKLSSPILMEDIFDRCSGIIRSKDSMCIYKAAPLLCEMINELYFSARKSGTEESGERDFLSAVKEYIDKNFSSDITLDELASISGVGREYFCTLFRRKTGMRPFEYIASIRIREAKRLLAYTELPVAEIGKRVGFSDKSYFGHVFKRYAGMPPTAFRGH